MMNSIKIIGSCLIILSLTSCKSVFRHESPGFTVTYPSYLRKYENPQKLIPAVVFEAMYGYVNLKISVRDKPKELSKLDDLVLFHIGLIKSLYPRSSDHKIIKEEMITLNDGTRAMSTLIKWRIQPGYPMAITSSVRAFKEKKVIGVTATMPESTSIEPIEKITHSLEFAGREIAQRKDSEQAKTEKQKNQRRITAVTPILTGEATRVAVMDFRANGISQLIASNVSELVRNELIIMGNLVVLERS
jgi:hypothetical protein